MRCCISLSPRAIARWRKVALRLDVPLQYVIDALLRQGTDEQLLARVMRQRDLDAAARAACSPPR